MAIKALFLSGRNDATTENLYQWDYGQQLEIESPDLGSMLCEVHFACHGMSEAIVRPCTLSAGIGDVTIPDDCLEQSSAITAWIYEKGVDSANGRTRGVITIPVVARTRPGVVRDIPPETNDQYTLLIAEVNDAINKIEDGTVKAKYAGEADTAKTASHATSADSATTAESANYATTAGTASSATNATSAGFATNAGTANTATSAGFATNAGTATALNPTSLVESTTYNVPSALIGCEGVFAVRFRTSVGDDGLAFIVIKSTNNGSLGTRFKCNPPDDYDTSHSFEAYPVFSDVAGLGVLHEYATDKRLPITAVYKLWDL